MKTPAHFAGVSVCRKRFQRQELVWVESLCEFVLVAHSQALAAQPCTTRLGQLLARFLHSAACPVACRLTRTCTPTLAVCLHEVAHLLLHRERLLVPFAPLLRRELVRRFCSGGSRRGCCAGVSRSSSAVRRWRGERRCCGFACALCSCRGLGWRRRWRRLEARSGVRRCCRMFWFLLEQDGWW